MEKNSARLLLFCAALLPSVCSQNDFGAGARPVCASELTRHNVDEVIYLISSELDVDPFLIKAVIKAESNFDPFAVSPKGAIGLMQLMPETARAMGVMDPFDPIQNIFGGSKYLRALLQRYDGDIVLALAAYNAGPGKVKGSVPDYPETRSYIQRVSKNYRRYLTDD